MNFLPQWMPTHTVASSGKSPSLDPSTRTAVDAALLPVRNSATTAGSGCVVAVFPPATVPKNQSDRTSPPQSPRNPLPYRCGSAPGGHPVNAAAAEGNPLLPRSGFPILFSGVRKPSREPD